MAWHPFLRSWWHGRDGCLTEATAPGPLAFFDDKERHMYSNSATTRKGKPYVCENRLGIHHLGTDLQNN